jgi:GNAT superfamily N-acetyltransferase
VPEGGPRAAAAIPTLSDWPLGGDRETEDSVCYALSNCSPASIAPLLQLRRRQGQARAGRRPPPSSLRSRGHVFEVDGEVLGVITSSYISAIRYGGEYARLEELIVDDKARGTGAGMALLKAAIAEAHRHGCSLVTLYSRETTRAFYEKAGFRYAGPELHRATG